jgi:hypothetical protein
LFGRARSTGCLKFSIAFVVTHLNRATSPVATRLATSESEKAKAAASDDSGLCLSAIQFDASTSV